MTPAVKIEQEAVANDKKPTKEDDSTNDAKETSESATKTEDAVVEDDADDIAKQIAASMVSLATKAKPIAVDADKKKEGEDVQIKMETDSTDTEDESTVVSESKSKPANNWDNSYTNELKKMYSDVDADTRAVAEEMIRAATGSKKSQEDEEQTSKASEKEEETPKEDSSKKKRQEERRTFQKANPQGTRTLRVGTRPQATGHYAIRSAPIDTVSLSVAQHAGRCRTIRTRAHCFVVLRGRVLQDSQAQLADQCPPKVLSPVQVQVLFETAPGIQLQTHHPRKRPGCRVSSTLFAGTKKCLDSDEAQARWAKTRHRPQQGGRKFQEECGKSRAQ
mmetsp:Transcript_440/g.952  ORF Transcript_440/g.952 Transcript_440/m.952 type:complete len:334 (-) Transcript_440:1667-2668(-)